MKWFGVLVLFVEVKDVGDGDGGQFDWIRKNKRNGQQNDLNSRTPTRLQQHGASRQSQAKHSCAGNAIHEEEACLYTPKTVVKIRTD